MSLNIKELVAVLHKGVSMTLDVEEMNSSEVLNLILACSEGARESRLVLRKYFHFDREELRRLALASKGKVTFDPSLN